jgi:hypothetical protein
MEGRCAEASMSAIEWKKRIWFERSGGILEDFRVFRENIEHFVQRQLERERYERLAGFEKDINYVKLPNKFYADFPEDAERIDYIAKRLNAISDLTYLEDFGDYREAKGYPRTPDPNTESTPGNTLDSAEAFRGQFKSHLLRHQEVKNATIDKPLTEFRVAFWNWVNELNDGNTPPVGLS